MASDSSKESTEIAKDPTVSYTPEKVNAAITSIAKLTLEISAINPVIGTLKESIETVKPYLQQSADFEFSIQELKNVLAFNPKDKNPKVDFEKLKTKILELSGKSSVSNTEFATIIKEGAFEGLSGNKATTESVANFAETGGEIITGLGLDPETTAQLLAKIRFDDNFDEKNILNFLTALQNKVGLKAIAPITSKILLETESIKQISAKETVALSTVFGTKDDSAKQTVESIKIFLNSIDPKGGKVSQKAIFEKLNKLKGFKGEELKAKVREMLSGVEEGDQKNQAIKDIIMAAEKTGELSKAFNAANKSNSGAFDQKVQDNSNQKINQLKKSENQIGNLDLVVGDKVWPDATNAMNLLGQALNDVTLAINQMSQNSFLAATAAGTAISIGTAKFIANRAAKAKASGQATKNKAEKATTRNIGQAAKNKVERATTRNIGLKAIQKLGPVLLRGFSVLGWVITAGELISMSRPAPETVGEDLNENSIALNNNPTPENQIKLQAAIDNAKKLMKELNLNLEQVKQVPSGNERRVIEDLEQQFNNATDFVSSVSDKIITVLKKHIKPQVQYIDSSDSFTDKRTAR